MELGYAISSEEHRPLDLVDNAVRAEEAGFGFALISDHFHPWIDRQGQSPFVWSVLGAIAAETERLVVGTGVTCPILRLHPAIVAQAAATAAAMPPSTLHTNGLSPWRSIHGWKWSETSAKPKPASSARTAFRTRSSGRCSSLEIAYPSSTNASLPVCRCSPRPAVGKPARVFAGPDPGTPSGQPRTGRLVRDGPMLRRKG